MWNLILSFLFNLILYFVVYLILICVKWICNTLTNLYRVLLMVHYDGWYAYLVEMDMDMDMDVDMNVL